MQLQNAKATFEQQGLKLAAISYDSRAILMDFAKRHEIEYPLLADADSKVIRSFNVLNVEAKYTDRFTANNVIGKLFPELSQEVSQNVEAPHLRLTLGQSDRCKFESAGSMH